MVSERVKVHVGLAAAVVVLLVCLVLLLIGTLYRGDLRAGLPGSVAPDFALRDADNNPVELSALRGDVVIVYFRGQHGDAPAPSTSPSSVVAALPADQPHAVAAAASETLSLNTAASTALNTGTVSASASADLSQLSAVSQQIHDPRLKILELTNPAALQDAPSVGTQSVGSFQADASAAVQTLIDPTGDVAREFKIDETDTKPTFFIIDPSGVIRYRGNSLQGAAAAAATNELASPATEPSSCPQMVQTLLSTEAVNLGEPSTTHF
jgi:peroxiredoxin